jgi:ribosomal protein S21
LYLSLQIQLMIIIEVNKKNIEAALKTYKYKVYKTQVHKKLWENKEYIKDSVKNREKMNKAIYVNDKFKKD